MRPSFLFFAMVLLCSSCSKTPEISGGNQQKIGDDLVIYMIDDGSGLTLETKTVEEFPCSNYPIIYTMEKKGLRIVVHYRYVLLSNSCQTSFGPATADVNIGNLEPAEYTLVLKCNGSELVTPLTVSGDKYSVANAAAPYLKFYNTEALRLPGDLLWGYIEDEELHADEQFIKTFNDSLANIGATPFKLAPGYYTPFIVNENEEIIVHEQKGFLYKYAGDFHVIKRLMNSYHARYKDSIDIVVYNSKGQMAYSRFPNP